MRSALLVLLASSAAYADAYTQPPLTIESVFDGQRGTAQTAPDPGGAAGSEQVLDVDAGFITVRDSTGFVLASSSADTFWTTAGVTGAPAAVSQRAVFNALNQRWYISAEEATTGTPNRIYLAVSASGDARGPWKAVTLAAQAQPIANTQLAVDPCGAYITGDTAGAGVVMTLPSADLHWTSGAPSAAHLGVMPTLVGVAPAIDPWNQVGSDARMFVARDGTSNIDVLRLHWQSPLCSSTLSATLGSPSAVSLGAAYPAPSRAAVQPGPAPGLAAGNGAIASAVTNNGVIVGIATTQLAGQIAAVWFKIYADPSNATGASLEQVSTIIDPSADLIAPAIAFEPYNGVGVVLVRTSANSPPGIYITAEAFGDYQMRELMPARAGTAAYSCAPVAGVSSFGRYSSIAATATGFWAVAQYGASATPCEYGTAWINFDVQGQSASDDVIFGDDAGYHPPPHPHPWEFGCGCSSHGDASSLVIVAAVALLLRRKRASRH